SYNNMELIKNTIRVGNSAGVLLPKEWLNSQVKIILEPRNIEKDIFEILLKEDLMKDILGLYLVGSYARGEQTIESDIDVLAITENTNKRIKSGKYEIICISEKELKKQLSTNILPVLAMLKEAKTIINPKLVKEYSNSRLNAENLKFHIETTKSAMKVVEKDIKISKEIGEKVSDDIIYSLILRLRTLYIIECIRKNKPWSKKDFLKLIKGIAGSTNSYEAYIRSKNNKPARKEVSAEEAEKLRKNINIKLSELETWPRGKRD
ncbi:MAG: DUF2080 family transposase-associated protein, partial [Nanoarchaeota archaeon]|nr:DUF2080 family transposase-associated protein [Nanoarchaeota archaeon]